MTPPDYKMDDENVLREKLNVLQAQMLDFHKRISPVKELLQDKKSSKSISENIQITCFNIFINILKVIVTFIGPIVFPSLVYYAEGCSPLFWEAIAISSFIILAVVTITFSILWNNAKKIKTHASHIIYYLDNLKDKITFKINKNATFERFHHNKFLQILGTSLCLSMIIASSWLVYGRYTPVLFYAFLTSIGFILRIMVVQVTAYLKDEKKLPLHNPCEVKVNLVKSSPRARRELDFSDMGKVKSLPFFTSPSRPASLQGKNRVKNIQAYHHLNVEHLLTTPPPSYQEAVRDSSKTQIFSNLKNFFNTP